jgi:hypothetical protein
MTDKDTVVPLPRRVKLVVIDGQPRAGIDYDGRFVEVYRELLDAHRRINDLTERVALLEMAALAREPAGAGG